MQFREQGSECRTTVVDSMKALAIAAQKGSRSSKDTDTLVNEWKQWRDKKQQSVVAAEYPVLEALLRLGRGKEFLGNFPFESLAKDYKFMVEKITNVML